ncbi:MAG: glycosyltransferase family 39 protein [Pyrinomonadaceae bacterium]|nr:glycosyltransferase family 39 protein [Pyrinomonadaceae bacterium]
MVNKPNRKRNGIIVYALLLTAAFSFRLALARLLPNEEPVDSQVYAQLARNLLDHRVYSPAIEPPFEPSFIRLPGYPLFLAGVYSIFGLENNTSVRVVQALVDTLSCGLIALMAFLWEPDRKLKRRTSINALALAAFCPFTAIYVATILPETLTIFFSLAMCLTATLAFKATTQRNVALLWGATGLLAGAAVLVRPDSGLFAAAIGITLVVTTLGRASEASFTNRRDEILFRFARASYLGALFSLAFCLALVPWAIRNSRVFGVFQPLAPTHAAMPGEFVPRGYFAWLRTWLDDSRYVGPMIWGLDEFPIKLDDIPDQAFDSPEEKLRVATLLEKYNRPGTAPGGLPDDGSEEPSPLEDQRNQGDEAESGQTFPEEQADESDELSADELSAAQPNSQSPPGSSEQSPVQPVQMTPEIDAGFARIAKERVARNRLRYYLLLPARRGVSLWFDTHSQYYPFEGELLPLQNLDSKSQQQIWLPLFAGLTLFYTALGILGGRRLWQSNEFEARRWLLLATLLIFLRIAYFATLENPEPRYTVELFPFLAILGGIAARSLATELSTKAGRRK